MHVRRPKNELRMAQRRPLQDLVHAQEWLGAPRTLCGRVTPETAAFYHFSGKCTASVPKTNSEWPKADLCRIWCTRTSETGGLRRYAQRQKRRSVAFDRTIHANRPKDELRMAKRRLLQDLVHAQQRVRRPTTLYRRVAPETAFCSSFQFNARPASQKRAPNGQTPTSAGSHASVSSTAQKAL